MYIKLSSYISLVVFSDFGYYGSNFFYFLVVDVIANKTTQLEKTMVKMEVLTTSVPIFTF